MQTTAIHNEHHRSVVLLRRLLVIVYDSLLLTAILFFASALVIALNHGEAIDTHHRWYLLYLIYLLIISFIYFGWFWTHGGQTLGMKTWRVMLISSNSQTISWKQALIRAIVALFSWGISGLGFIWSLFHKNKCTWHDIASNTILIDLRDR